MLQRQQQPQQQLDWHQAGALLWQLDNACIRAARGEQDVDFVVQPRPWHVAQALAMRTAAARDDNFEDTFDYAFLAYDIALHVVKHYTFPEDPPT